MLAAIIRFALGQRVLVLLLGCGIVALGYRAFLSVPIDAFPDVSPTQVKIIVKAPGMTPAEVEQRITVPIELEVLGLPKQTMLRSVTKYALTDITLDFAMGTDIYWARQQVAERLGNVWSDLPADVEGGMAPMTTPLGEMFMFTLDSETVSLQERRRLLDWVIRPALRGVTGVADVNALGGFVRAFEVIPDPVRLAARGITTATLIAAIERNNRNDGAGRLTQGEESLLVRSEGQITTTEQLARIVVAPSALRPVTVGDVADVRIGSITRYGAVSENGVREAVEGLVLGLRGANARQVVAGVRAKLAELEKALPADVHINVFYDRGDLVDRAVATVSRALGEATVLVLVLLIVFLGNLRPALTVALILPLSVLATFEFMRQTGLSANLMSLGGLAIAIGILVDTAVVMVENIVSRLGNEQLAETRPNLHIVYRAAREVATPLFSGVLIIMVVFLPLLTLQGLEGLLFAPVAKTIVFALGASLLLSFTLIPVVASWTLRGADHHQPWIVRQLERGYVPLLDWCLARPRIVIGLAVMALVASGLLFGQIGKSFMPTMDEGDIIIQLEKIPSVSLEQSIAIDQRVQRALLAEVPEIKRIVARAGSDEIGLDPMGLNETDSFLVLKPREQWTVASKDELIAKMRAVMEGFPGLAYGFTQPIEMRVSEMLTGVRGDVAVKLFGDDLDALNENAGKIAAALTGIDGAEDVYTARNEGVQYLQLRIDQDQAGRLGLDVETLAGVLRTQIEGRRAGIVREGVERTPVIVRGDGADSRALGEMVITLPDGHRVQLSTVARIEHTAGLVKVEREQGSRFTVVRANVRGRDLVGFVEEARATIAESVALPEGYFVQFGGEYENQQRAAARLLVVVPLAIGLVFLILFSTFGRVRYALLVLTNIPFAMIGGVFALYVAQEYLSVPASVGFIALLGIAVLNGLVMLSHFNQLRAAGMPLTEAIREGSVRRLRPVLMTASIAALGLVPLLFASGPGSEIQRPLAIVVIGGLFSSTILTLLMLPILYRRFSGVSEQ